MPGLHETRRQIRSTRNTQQITKAMELVAASRMRRAQERAVGARPYADGLETLLRRLLETKVPLNDPLFIPNSDEAPILYVLVTADRGLCGGYNANMLRLFTSESRSSVSSKTIVVGRKGREFCRKSGVETTHSYHFPDTADYILAAKIAGEAVQLYLRGEISKVQVLYTRFLSSVAHRPTVMTLLPVTVGDTDSVDGETIPEIPYILEPSPSHLMSSLLPRYLSVQVHKALLESKASELASRMIAMGSATDNAEQIIQELSLKYNRERQAAITREISEIVGGANALK